MLELGVVYAIIAVKISFFDDLQRVGVLIQDQSFQETVVHSGDDDLPLPSR